MQRVQRPALHSRHAAGAARPGPRLTAGRAHALLVTPQQQRWQQQCQHQGEQQQHQRRHHQQQQRLGRPGSSSVVACAAAEGAGAGAGGDPLRAKAQAAAPVQPPAAAAVDANGAGAAGPAGAGPPGGQSYSSYYRSQNTKYYAPTAPGSSSSNNGSNGAGGAKHAPAHAGESEAADHSQQQQQQQQQHQGVSVDDALKTAQDALAAAETSLAVDSSAGAELRAALLARALKAWLVVRPVVLAGAFSVFMVASHAFGLALQWAAATLSALGIAAWGHRRGSLSPSGAVAAAVVGLATLGCSLRLGATLLAFFFASSKLTHFKEELKEGIEEGAKRGGQRDWKQVLCNSGVPTLLAIGYGALAGCLDLPFGAAALPGVETWRADLLTLLMGGFLGYYACCCGDTWASELGVLSTDAPRLITTLRPVRRGTNGGVTLLGLSASLAGGLFVGAVFYLAAVVSPTLWVFDLQRQAALAQWKVVPLGLVAGLFGSLVDSLLGGTVQFTGYDVTKQKITGKPGPDVVHISGLPFLSNNAVNLISATITSAVTALAAVRLFG